MRPTNSLKWLTISCLLAFTPGAESADVRNIGRGDGYSVSFVQAEPKPGTKLLAESTVQLKVTVQYKLDAADSGRIVLVLQDEAGRLLFPGSKQVSVGVTRGSGEVTLEQEFQIPKGIKRIKLSIPLMPAGMTRSSGELLIEYGVRRK